MATTRKCGTCFGTGQVLCLRSAFIADGYRRERCGICSGSGFSAYRDDTSYIRWQRQARVRDGILRRVPKGLDAAQIAALVRRQEVSA